MQIRTIWYVMAEKNHLDNGGDWKVMSIKIQGFFRPQILITEDDFMASSSIDGMGIPSRWLASQVYSLLGSSRLKFVPEQYDLTLEYHYGKKTNHNEVIRKESLPDNCARQEGEKLGGMKGTKGPFASTRPCGWTVAPTSPGYLRSLVSPSIFTTTSKESLPHKISVKEGEKLGGMKGAIEGPFASTRTC